MLIYSSTTLAASAPIGATSAAHGKHPAVVSGTHNPGLLTYGNMFTVLPFGNATVVGKMTGAQDSGSYQLRAKLLHGVIQPAGLEVQVLLI